MAKTLAMRFDDAEYEEMMGYASSINSNLTAMARHMVRQGFLKNFEEDERDLKRNRLLLSSQDPNSEGYVENPYRFSELTHQEKADLERSIKILEARTSKFRSYYEDLISKLYGGEENA